MAEGALYKFASGKLEIGELGKTGIIEKGLLQPSPVNAEMTCADQMRLAVPNTRAKLNAG